MDLDNVEDASKRSESSMSKKLKQNEDASTSDPGNSTSVAESDLSYHDDEDECGDAADDVSDYGDDDFLYEDDFDDYSIMQSQYDNVDLPPGVEASVPWLKDPSPSENIIAAMSTSTLPSLQAKFDAVDLPAGAEISIAPGLAENKMKAAVSSSSTVFEGGNKEDEVMRNYESFRPFDTVAEFSDHHYSGAGLSGHQPDKNWAKKIQEEWKILEKNLPDTIFVRVCETRMDLLRAVIIGPAGTPYHDGLFTFDAFFPPAYPSVPPMVFYYSGGLRLNPNLYDCGKVCLSLLGTWTGISTEMWVPEKSTMLQVLISIQALILNAEPFFNEPGYEDSYKGAVGQKESKKYNEEAFILSLKTMTYTLRRPPRHFEDLVVGHFLKRAHDILLACIAYMDGTPIGSAGKGGTPDQKSVSIHFRDALSKMIKMLSTIFTKNGAKDLPQI